MSRATYALDLLHNIEDGIVQGNSYSFVCTRDSWSIDREGRHIRTVEEVSELWDVGPVTYPAYGDSGIDVARRSFAKHLESAQQPQTNEALRAVRERHRELTDWLEKHGVK